MYYLGTRWYDPVIGRFISPDKYVSTGQGILGHNMYAYCNNNPVNFVDPSGRAAISVTAGIIVGGAVAGAAISSASYLITSNINGTEITGSSLLNAAGVGAFTGGVGAIVGTLGKTYVAIGATLSGIVIGVTSALNSDGPIQNRILTGVTAGIIATAGAYIGAHMPLALESGFTAAVTAFAGGLFIGAPAEMINVFAQTFVSNILDLFVN